MQFIVQKQQERSILETDKEDRVFRVRGTVVQPGKIDRWKKRNEIADDQLYAPSPTAGKGST
jgi:hypothetical protein